MNRTSLLVLAGSVAALELTAAELQAAFDGLPDAQRHALEAAADRVRRYHQRQLQACGLSWQYTDEDGTLLGQKVTPLDRVGIYVPGGKAAYPSSVLMNALPAKVAEQARTRAPEGQGLGLDIVHRVAALHGYSLHLQASEFGGLQVDLAGPCAAPSLGCRSSRR